MTNLDRCWKNCLRMWKWVSENLPKRFTGLSTDDKEGVIDRLKQAWLGQNRFTKAIDHHCFFCEYDETVLRLNDSVWPCDNCPGKKVGGEQFHCCNTTYHYRNDPKAFYRKLLELDAKRTGKKKP